jgi:uncharacterized membrane protein
MERPVYAAIDRRHWKKIVFALLGAITLFDIYMDEGFVLHPHSPEWNFYYSFRWWLIPHVVCSCIALAVGPTQFSSRLRRRSLHLHRALGKLYVAAIAVAAPLAIVMEFRKDNTNLLFPTYTQASLWMITTAMAFVNARRRRITQHRRWMVRSYCVTCIFVVGKAILHVPGLVRIRGLTLPAFLFTFQLLALLGPDLVFDEYEARGPRSANPRRES